MGTFLNGLLIGVSIAAGLVLCGLIGRILIRVLRVRFSAEDEGTEMFYASIGMFVLAFLFIGLIYLAAWWGGYL